MKNLKFKFQKQLGHDIVAKGEFDFLPRNYIIGIQGPSGCGKTTFLRWIAGLEKTSAAGKTNELSFNREVWCSGEISLTPQQRNLGMLSQGDLLFPHLDVADNIRFGVHKVPKAERARRLEQIVTIIGVQSLLSRNVHSLSGGEKRRVALAQTLITQPRLLLLDEPFTGLDDETVEKLINDTKAWVTQLQIPTLLITHSARELNQITKTIFKFQKVHSAQNESFQFVLSRA